MAKVTNHQKQLSPRQQWLQIWKQCEQDFTDLPDWTQKIILQDINTAFKNRIKTMKQVNQKNIKKQENEPISQVQILAQRIEGGK
jgi:hypothetical protein